MEKGNENDWCSICENPLSECAHGKLIDQLRHYGKCLNCNSPLSDYVPLDLGKLDIKKCEQTKPDGQCYITGTLCKNVKISGKAYMHPLDRLYTPGGSDIEIRGVMVSKEDHHTFMAPIGTEKRGNSSLFLVAYKGFAGKSCRTLKPDSWRNEVKRQKARNKVSDKFYIDGKLNERKRKLFLKKQGLSIVPNNVLDRGELARERYSFLTAYDFEKLLMTNKKFCSPRCQAEYHNKSL